MSSKPIIRAVGVSKAYTIYQRPEDRLKQMIWRHRRKYYQEFWALRNINLEVFPGETLGIIGRNGSGKSTLLQLICGTLFPTWGQIEVRGRVAALLELGAGFNPEFTGIENLYLNASILGLSDCEIKERVDRIVSFADIGEFIERPVKIYSSGMYARLAFAVAVHVDPEVLIVDEILAVGDAAFQRKCVSKFYEIKRRGTTILFVSHDSYQVKNLCDRAIYLSHGQCLALGDAAEVVDQYTHDLEKEIKTTASVPDGQLSAALEPALTHELFRIENVFLEDEKGEPLSVIRSGQDIRLRFLYSALTREFPRLVSFVFNLYRHDDLYICGATTLMEKLEPFSAHERGEVIVSFPKFPLNAGRYVWRVAINDEGGLHVHAHAKYVCPFQVVDDFKAVGVVNLERHWTSGAQRSVGR